MHLRPGDVATNQGGEFAFVAFGMAERLGILDRQLCKLLLTTVAISMAATPALSTFSAWVADQVTCVFLFCTAVAVLVDGKVTARRRGSHNLGRVLRDMGSGADARVCVCLCVCVALRTAAVCGF